MDQHLMEGRYYQFVGKVREWLGNVVGNDIEADLGRRDQLVGRIAEHCRVPLEEAEALATEATGLTAREGPDLRQEKPLQNCVKEDSHHLRKSLGWD
jgi:uncharacterized protein YjbJ (UPF0337 family)